MRGFLRRLLFAALVFTLAAGVVWAGNVGPMMIQNLGLDLDNPGQFWSNIGGGPSGKLTIGSGLSNQSGALTANLTSVFGRSGTVILLGSDVTGALGYMPVNRAGDTLTGPLIPTTTSALAASGTSAATATAITAQHSIFTTVNAGTGGQIAGTVGFRQVVWNRGSNILSIYPQAGQTIEGLSVVGIAAGGEASILCVSSTVCYSGS